MDNTVAFIPLRGGSKSIPNKNIKTIAGKPLAWWAIEAAANCDIIDKVYVATDSDLIAETVNSFGNSKVFVIPRSAESATDTASTEVALIEFCEEYSFNNVFLIQATSPLLSAKDLTGGFEKLKESKADSVLSVVRQKRFIWGNNGEFASPINYDYMNRPRRQDYDGYLVENGAFYISTRDNILKSRNRLTGNIAAYEMPENTFVEIDEVDDFHFVENHMYRNNMVKRSASKIKLFLTDVDGVLTDAGMYYTEFGDEIKKFSTYDGMAFKLLKEAGIKVGIITTENTKIVERRAQKLKADYLYQGKGEGGKLSAALEICKLENISLQEVAYIGDDINCFDLLSNVGLAACPKNANKKIKEIPSIIHLSLNGGEGVVREFYELIVSGNL